MDVANCVCDAGVANWRSLLNIDRHHWAGSKLETRVYHWFSDIAALCRPSDAFGKLPVAFVRRFFDAESTYIV